MWELGFELMAVCGRFQSLCATSDIWGLPFTAGVLADCASHTPQDAQQLQEPGSRNEGH